MKSILRICMAIVAGSVNLQAQSAAIKLDRISLEQGLSQLTVHCILQDSKGFMWFGTYDGLNKYDGYTFKVYRPDPEHTNSLSNNYVRSIHEDQSGVLWVGTFGGLNRFDRNTETFRHYENDPDNPSSLSDNFVRSIHEDQSGVLWIGTNDGLSRFNRETEAFTQYKNRPNNPNSLSQNRIHAIYADGAGSLWIGTAGGGLDELNIETGTFTHYKNDPNDMTSLNDNEVRSIYEDQSGVLWIGTAGGGLNRFERDTGGFTHYMNDPGNPKSLSNNDVESIYEDRSGALWIGTFGGGLNRLNRETGTFLRYDSDPGDPDSLSNNVVRSLYEDQSGVLWIGTDGGGLNKFSKESERFKHYENEPKNANSLSDNFIWSIHEDQSGVLWIGTDGGVLNQMVPSEGNELQGEPETFTHHVSTNHRVRSIHEDQSGVLWVGTAGGGLSRFNRETGEFTHYENKPNEPTSLSDNVVWSIYEDSSDVLWIGTGGSGLNRFNRGTETFTRYQNDPDKPKSLSDDDVWSIYEDHVGMLWIGTGAGLDRFDRDAEEFQNYKNEPGNRNSLSNNVVTSIYESSAQKGVLWIGTNGGGLNRFDTQQDTFTHYRQKDGLPNDVIYGILEDNNGNLWLSTNNGLSRFAAPLSTKKVAATRPLFRNYDVQDGLQGNEFNVAAYYKSRTSGRLFFGGPNGFNVFHPDELEDNPHIPAIVITDLQIFNQSVAVGTRGESPLQRHITETEVVVLSYRDYVFSFEFAALHYSNPGKNQYAYKMDGFDNDWIQSGTRRFTTYTNLDPGEYVFRVKGSNRDGVWNEEGASIGITITPPFWQTWWFRGMAVVSVLGMAFGWHRARIRNIEAQRRKLEVQVAEKTREIREAQAQLVQSEKMASLGTLTAGIGHEINTPAGALKSTLDTMDRCSTKINEILENSETVGEVKSNPDYQKSVRILKENRRIASSAGERITAVVNSLRNFTRLDEAEFQKVDIHEGIESALTLIQHEIGDGLRVIKEYGDIPKIECFPGELNQAFMTLLRNAIQAVEEEGTITVKTSADEVNVYVTIADTGRGMPPEKLKSLFDFSFTVKSSRVGVGMELSNAYNVVRKHNGELKVESEVGKGTAFTISLPIQR